MILFIDDERRRMDSYVQELAFSGYEVEFQTDVDSALEFFTNNHAQIELLILDIMIPTGQCFNDNQTDYGLRTGLVFYTVIRKQKPTLPIIIFTNVSDTILVEQINKDCEAQFCQKDNLLPFELKKEVRKMLSR